MLNISWSMGCQGYISDLLQGKVENHNDIFDIFFQHFLEKMAELCALVAHITYWAFLQYDFTCYKNKTYVSCGSYIWYIPSTHIWSNQPVPACLVPPSQFHVNGQNAIACNSIKHHTYSLRLNLHLLPTVCLNNKCCSKATCDLIQYMQ